MFDRIAFEIYTSMQNKTKGYNVYAIPDCVKSTQQTGTSIELLKQAEIISKSTLPAVKMSLRILTRRYVLLLLK